MIFTREYTFNTTLKFVGGLISTWQLWLSVQSTGLWNMQQLCYIFWLLSRFIRQLFSLSQCHWMFSIPATASFVCVFLLTTLGKVAKFTSLTRIKIGICTSSNKLRFNFLKPQPSFKTHQCFSINRKWAYRNYMILLKIFNMSVRYLVLRKQNLKT